MRKHRGHALTGFVACNLAIAMGLAITTPGQDTKERPTSQPLNQDATTYDELKELLKTRYDGTIVVAELPGLYAGEQKKNFLGGSGENGITWSHYASNMPVPNRVGTFLGKKASDLNQLDDHTFGDLSQGLNVSPIQKGESLKVYKFYVYPEYIQFVLSTTGLEHMRDLDVSKASKEVTTTVSGNQVNQTVSVGGFGLVFRFLFNKGVIKNDHDYASVVKEIDKYFLPQSEAQEKAAAKDNIDIEPGMSEEQILQKLGQPLQTVRFGNQKTLKYKGMSIVLKDGKVIDLKVE
jgi:hypothetical protein